jgi:hypothetical protein
MRAAPLPDNHESAALEWATDFFRSCAADMTPAGSRRAAVEFGLNTILSGYDAEVQNHSENLDSRLIGLIKKLEGTDLLPSFAAALLERGDKLPAPLKDFVVAFLRDPGRWQTRQRGRKTLTLTIRNSNIGAAVGFVAAQWKFPVTRNRAQKIRRACAASIVRDALASGARIHLSESDVVKAWAAFRRLIAGLGWMTVGRGEEQFQIVTGDFLRRKN